MRKIPFIAGGLALGLLVATVFATDKKQPTLAEANAAISELTKQVDALQSKVKDMEQRLAKVEKAKAAQIVTLAPANGAPVFTLPPALRQRSELEKNFADPANPPKIWGEGEFNGWKYYMIPLSSAGGEAATPIPLAGR